MREAMPAWVEPMRARPASGLPSDQSDWAYEMKWDGVRALIWVLPAELKILAADQRDITWRYPELSSLMGEVHGQRAILDGEIVGLDARGNPSYEALQQRLGFEGGRKVPGRPGIPIAFMAFDLLHLDDRSLTPMPYEERRACLEALSIEGRFWHTPPALRGQGERMLQQSREHDLGGIIAKRLGSPYEAGVRNNAWIAVKNRQQRDVVIGGWLAGAGGRSGGIGSLVVGHRDDEGRFICVGTVGSGLNNRERAEIERLLEPLAIEHCPFDGGAIPAGALFVEPRVGCKVDFTEWTTRGTLRHPLFKGLHSEPERPD
jgi:bifunctional non-homologous end joining protein LigD